jgi:branched-chain amino acid transport system permease protein
MALLLVMVGITQSWNVSLAILNLCLISAVMSLGLNIQWGYAGLFNAGVMASTALGGLAAVLVSHSSVGEAWAVGGEDAGLAIITLSITVLGAWWIRSTIPKGSTRAILFAIWLLGGYALLRYFYEQASLNIEAVDPARTGFLGGLGLPILFSWLVGGLAAAGLAWIVGRVALGLRSDYFAIATLGISEIMISILKNEDWLTRGVKNVTGLERPVPYEIDLQQSEWFIDLVIRLHSPDLSQVGEEALGEMVMLASGVFVKLCYSALFLAVLLIILGLAALALNSPWGRMMRAIRDNEIAAAAMGKDVTSRHRQVFILGSAVIGVAGAMLTTLDGQFTPGTYIPLRFTFLIWVMVIVGGSGNNLGAVLGAFITWFTWIEAEPVALWAVEILNSFLSEENPLRQHFIDVSPHLRMVIMGLILTLVLRFRPEGILPEKNTSRT